MTRRRKFWPGRCSSVGRRRSEIGAKASKRRTTRALWLCVIGMLFIQGCGDLISTHTLRDNVFDQALRHTDQPTSETVEETRAALLSRFPAGSPESEVRRYLVEIGGACAATERDRSDCVYRNETNVGVFFCFLFCLTGRNETFQIFWITTIKSDRGLITDIALGVVSSEFDNVTRTHQPEPRIL